MRMTERVRFGLEGGEVGGDEWLHMVELMVLTCRRNPSHRKPQAVNLRVMREKRIERIKRELTELDGEKKTDLCRYRPIIECAPCYKDIYGAEGGYEEQNSPKGYIITANLKSGIKRLALE
jgi:hypothetical protein